MKIAAPLVAATALLIGVISIVPEAAARRIGGVHVRHHVAGGRNIHRHVAVNHHYGHHRHGRWVNGVWVVNGIAASVAVGTASNCSYYHRRWKETGRIYWRDRYYEACR